MAGLLNTCVEGAAGWRVQIQTSILQLRLGFCQVHPYRLWRPPNLRRRPRCEGQARLDRVCEVLISSQLGRSDFLSFTELSSRAKMGAWLLVQ